MSNVRQIDGRPVIDARRPVKLIVTRSDVKGADTKEPANCAVARACRRDLYAAEVRVHLGRVYIRSNENNWVRYITPGGMRDEIIAFDRGGKFEPGEFRLMAPQRSKTLGKKSGGTKPYTKRGKKRAAPHIVTNVRTGPVS